MASMVNESVDRSHLLRTETRPRMVKADVRKAENDDAWRVSVGRAIERVRGLLGWNLDQLAEAVKRDPRQVARWIAGTERPHVDAIFRVPELRAPLVQAFAELSGEGIEIETVIRVRRRA